MEHKGDIQAEDLERAADAVMAWLAGPPIATPPDDPEFWVDSALDLIEALEARGLMIVARPAPGAAARLDA